MAVIVSVITLIGGAAAGFIYGDKQGRAASQQELADLHAGRERAMADLQAAQTKLTSAAADLENQKQRAAAELAAAVEREQVAARRVSDAEAKVQARSAEADALARRPKEEHPREEHRAAETAAKTPLDHLEAIKVIFKDFVRSPEQFRGRCVRIDGVWLSGALQDMPAEKLLSATVSSDDHQYVYARQSLKHGDGLVFVVPANIGRELSNLPHDFKFKTNLCCEVSPNGNGWVAHIYRIETRDLNHLWAEQGRELVYQDK
jgi:hypothetical protein